MCTAATNSKPQGPYLCNKQKVSYPQDKALMWELCRRNVKYGAVEIH